MNAQMVQIIALLQQSVLTLLARMSVSVRLALNKLDKAVEASRHVCVHNSSKAQSWCGYFVPAV